MDDVGPPALVGPEDGVGAPASVSPGDDAGASAPVSSEDDVGTPASFSPGDDAVPPETVCSVDDGDSTPADGETVGTELDWIGAVPVAAQGRALEPVPDVGEGKQATVSLSSV